MDSIGERLRRARIEKGLTLAQIYEKTRISLKNLEAIERDELTHFSSPFFYKSFVRQIADHLGLEYRSFVADVDAAARLIPEPLMPGQNDAPLPPKAAMPECRPKRRMRWLYSLGSLLTMFALCSAAYAAWEGARSGLPPQAILAQTAHLSFLP